MPEQFRTRDVIVLYKGDTYPVTVDSAMAQGGWAGGQGIQWVHSGNDEFQATYSDGLYCGFSLFGSNEDSDLYTAMTGQQSSYRYTTACAGGWLIMTRTFEKYTYASRQSGPLVPITYQASDRLVFSNRGLFTNQDEWTLSGDSRAPNTYYIAFVVQPPSAATNEYMTIQVSI